jgi:hypothetical protein
MPRLTASGAPCHDDGDRLGRVFSSLRRSAPNGNDNVTVETNQLGGKFWQMFILPLRMAELNGEVLPLDVTDLA